MKKILLLLFIIVTTSLLFAQNKKPLDFDAYNYWKTLKHQKISDNGQWVCYESVPYKGDLILNIINPNTQKTYKINRAENSVFSPSSKFIAFKIKAEYKKTRALKVKKTKKNKFPKDSLGIVILNTGEIVKFKKLKAFKTPKKESEWIAYLQIEDKKEKKDSVKKKKVKGLPKLYNLNVFNPVNNKEHKYKNVSEMSFSKTGKLLGFIQYNDNKIYATVKILNTETGKLTQIFSKEGLAKNISLDNKGNSAAFIYSSDTLEIKKYNLTLWQNGDTEAKKIILSANSNHIPKGWGISKHGKIWFSEDDSKLYFGTAIMEEETPKDTLLNEEKVNVDIWSWKDEKLQTEQLANLKKDKKKNYLTVYHIKSNTVARLESELIDNVKTILKGNANIAFGVSTKPFAIKNTWTYPSLKNIYIIDVITGNKKLIVRKTQGEINISAFGNYIFWYQNSNWFTYNIKTKVKKSLTEALNVDFNDFTHDYPYKIPSYSYAGWTKNDKYLLVYDKHDIWKLDPNGIEKPVNLTDNYGKIHNIRLRYLNLDKEKTYIDLQNSILLSGFNYSNKQSGYFQKNIYKKAPIKLVMDNYRFYDIKKAKNNNAIIWRKSSVKEFSNLWYSKNEAAKPIKISDFNPQQEKYNWATAELVKWKSYGGKNMEGILYKPENFDPNKKYPMLVYFYRLSSHNLHAHYFIKPSRSTINPILYASNEYLVFIPDIKYETGHPGESSYNCIVSGTKAMIEKGFVDADNIGIQGQSWGGYQVAYIITQINLFKAASAGAPVSNMTSAYGGIRYKTGMSRMYQYENTQSRIGATLWEKRDLYIENSPIFHADKIKTPLLIRHDDNDGAVPWQQGIELFVAMRRLGKPAWLLNYNGQPHNLKDKSPQGKDLSIRMMQFFNHYLKGKAAPNWLKYGIPALKKGKTLGYEIED